MLTSGAGVNKVEETLAAIGRAYGASRMDVFVITSCAIVTMYPEDSCAVTQTRRILSPGSPNFSRVEAFSKLSKECERTPITLEELTDRVESIVSRQYPEKLIYLGSVLAAGGFAVFFGGTLMDGILAAAAGAFVCYCQRRLAWISPNQVVYLFLCALCAGFVISAMGAAFRELGRFYGIVLMVYLTILGWSVATLYYQITLGHQALWIAVPCALLVSMFGGFRIMGRRRKIQFI